MNPMVESAWITAGAVVVGVVSTATVGIVGYFISRSTNRETIASAREANESTIETADAHVRQTLEAARQGQLTDRYTKAVEQLGSSNLNVRLGGIYALEGVARDSERDHPIVMEMLTAFIREHSREQWPLQGRRCQPPPETRPDVQAALAVVGRRDVTRDRRPIDLSGAELAYVKLPRHAGLMHAKLVRTTLTGVDLTEQDLGGADLTGARLDDTVLTRAVLRPAELTDVVRADAKLPPNAGPVATKLIRTILAGADLTGADLTGADLTGADLTGALWPADKPAPEGWGLGTGSNRLERRDARASDSGPAAMD
jgi:hypothetical protein